MHNIIKAAFLLAIGTSAIGQQSINEVATSDPQSNLWSFNESQKISTSNFFHTYQESMGFDENYSFTLLSDTEDQLGIHHARYQQYYKGVKVEGAQIILH